MLKWEEVIETGHLISISKRSIKWNLEVVYEVKERVKKKQTKQFLPLASRNELTSY